MNSRSLLYGGILLILSAVMVAGGRHRTIYKEGNRRRSGGSSESNDSSAMGAARQRKTTGSDSSDGGDTRYNMGRGGYDRSDEGWRGGDSPDSTERAQRKPTKTRVIYDVARGPLPEPKPLRKPNPVDGGWSAWSVWETCTNNCDGMSSRVRTCTNPSPAGGGLDCEEHHREDRSCQYTTECGFGVSEKGGSKTPKYTIWTEKIWH